MSELTTRLMVAHLQATADPTTKPLYVGTVWILDELENALLAAARDVVALKAARACEDLNSFAEASRSLKRHVGQSQTMAFSLNTEIQKYQKPLEQKS